MPCCPPSELAFSQVREDPLVEWGALKAVARQTNRPLRVFLLGSGGETALTLLAHPQVATVEVVDQSDAQLALVALRQAAAQHLSLAEQRALLGVTPCADRATHYRSLRPHLPVPVRAHWDARPEQIAYGLHRVGRFEELFRELGRAFQAANVHPRRDAGSPAWRHAFAVVFEREKLARTFSRAAVDFSMDRGFDDHFAAVFEAAIARWGPGDNPFLDQVLTDTYASTLPPYLQADWQAQLRVHGLDRLRFHHGSCWDVLRQLPGTFDVIQTSNISDWIPVPALRDLLGEVAHRLRPGGKWVGRRLNGDHDLAQVASAHFDVQPVSDRAFFYSQVLVGTPR